MISFRIPKSINEIEVSRDGRDYFIIITSGKSNKYDKRFVVVFGPDDLRGTEWQRDDYDYLETIFEFEKDTIVMEDDRSDYIDVSIKATKTK